VHVRGLYLWPGRAEWSSAAEALQGVWRAVRILLLVPALIQVHLVIERRVASIVDADAVAALDYARFVTDTSVLLLAMPLGVAGLGAMAQLSEVRFRELAVRALRPLLYAGVPLSLAAALHAETIVRVIYARGAFDSDSVAATAAILRWSAPGIWGLLAGYAGAKFLSARGGNVRVMGLYAVAFGSNAAINLLLYPYLGVATLGFGAAANGVVFGLLVMGALGVFRECRRDLVTLAVLAAAYLALVWLAPAGFSANAWLPLLAFAAYWCAAVTLVPSCRQVIHDTWSSFRAA
jgi:putative peptidoglycan lipid II flippase